MLSLFKKKEMEGNEIVCTLEGMHCTSCAMNIDGALEDIDGVYRAQTSYAQSQVTIEFDPKKVTPKQLIDAIGKEGYTAIQKG